MDQTIEGQFILANKKISRKDFLRSLTWLTALPFVLIGAITVKRNSELTQPGFIHIPSKIPEGVTFHGDIIIVKEKTGIRFLSSKCTHLGCRINSTENDKLICPCHGSSFSLNGNNIKGPADRALTVLDYSVDDGNGDYVIELS